MVPQQISEIKVRLGGEVHLSCKNSNTFQDNCLSTRWLFNSSGSRPVETLFENGHVLKADRLSITDDCSLVIKKVTSEDAGLYACRQLVFRLMDDFTDYLLHLAVTNGEYLYHNGTLSVCVCASLSIFVGTKNWHSTILAGTKCWFSQI